MTEKIKHLKELVEHFKFNLSQYKNSNYDEANTRVDFIDKFFELLDWDVSNKQQFSEEWREVVREDKVTIQGKPKAPDYSFRIGGRRVFFVEAKKPSVDIKHDIGPAFQVRRYGYTAKVPLSILTDFEEFAVYDTRIKPNKNDKASVARIFYCTYEEYEKHFEFLYNTFSKNAILKGSFKKYVTENKAKKGTSEVDAEFLKLIEQWRNELAKNIALRNKELNIHELNYAVQKIIDRILFLRIAEDRQTEEYGALLKTTDNLQIFHNLNMLFDQADKKYNSGLFINEKFLNHLHIDDKILKNIIKGLYYPDSPYEFSILEVEILGNIYEQFLGKTIRLTPSHQAKVEEKPEVRKAGGVYYTPQFVVNYIVAQTVGRKIQNKTPQQISNIKIVDPACGSGSFLLGAYSYLLKYHLNFYSQGKNRQNALKNGVIYQASENTYYLTIKEKQRILTNCIFGVDIDPQAVEVTKLSLLLKLMEGENQESVGSLFKFSDFTLLPDLSQNIKCGNSLVGTDYYSSQQLNLFDDEQIRKTNAFDWPSEFSAVFEQGGFDVVIGNPPYVRQELLGDIKEYFKQKYQVFHGTADLYAYFIEKGISLLKSSGLFSYIVANKWLRANYGLPLRKWLKRQRILELVDFGDLQVFKGATTYPCILTVEKNQPADQFKVAEIKTLDFSDLKEYVEENLFSVNQDELQDSGWLLVDKKMVSLLKKLQSNGIPLKEYVKGKIYRGILTGLNEAFVIDKKTKEKLITEDSNSAVMIKPFLTEKDVKRYSVLNSDKFIIFTKHGTKIKNYPTIEKYLLQYKDRLQPKPKNYNGTHWKGRKPGKYKWYEIQDAVDYYSEFEKPKIIIPAISNRANYAYDTEGFYSNDKTSIIPTDDKYLFALLNSIVLDFYLKQIASTKRGGYFEYKPMYVSKLPIKVIKTKEEPEIRHKIISLVDAMLETQKKLDEVHLESERKLLQQKADLLDQEIDCLIYELYDLTEEEIEIIERNVKYYQSGRHITK